MTYSVYNINVENELKFDGVVSGTPVNLIGIDINNKLVKTSVGATGATGPQGATGSAGVTGATGPNNITTTTTTNGTGFLYGNGTSVLFTSPTFSIDLATPRLKIGTVAQTSVFDRDFVISKNSASLSLFNGSTSTNATMVLGESNTNLAVWQKIGSAVAGNYTNTSIAYANTNNIYSGSSFNQGLVYGGQPIYNIIGSAAANIGTRLDENGLKVASIDTLHTTVNVTPDIANFIKIQNGVTALRVINNSTGANAAATVKVSCDNDATGAFMFAMSSTSGYGGIYTPSTGVYTSNMSGGMNIGNISNTQLSFWTNNIHRGRFTNDGIFLVGRTTAVASADVANFDKNQNASTVMRITNTTSGTSAATYLNVENGSVGVSIGYISAGYTSAGMLQAGSTTIFSSATNGFNTGTFNSAQYSFWTNNTKRMEITPVGDISLGVGAKATGATSGFPYMPVVAGTPSGVPTSITGMVAFEYDSTNNKIWIYNGSWRSVALA